jgi:leucyl-tRNA synthetase
MILGYSYRYFDDDLKDEGGPALRRYSYKEVRQEGERVLSIEDGRELKARMLLPGEVRKTGEGAVSHPDFEGLELEEVIEKMSKSRGNVINPDEVIEAYGADAVRLYELFIGPIEKEAPWSTEGIQGVRRFLERAWRVILGDTGAGVEWASGPGTEAQQRLVARTIQGVSDDLEAMRFNTAISKLMVCARDVTKDAALPKEVAETFVLLLAPLAPHVAEEIWQRLGHADCLAHAPWPQPDAGFLHDERVTLVLQVNGKRRAEIEVAADADEATVRQAALACEPVQRHLDGREPRKVIVVPGRLVNVVG